MDRTTVGEREFSEATGGRGPVATGRVREASPVLADGVQEFIFADVFSRSGLSAAQRELVTVAVLCALGGAEPQLKLHIPAALECGVDADELVAMCEQIAPYAGFPRALNGLRAVREAIEERGLPLPLPAVRTPLGDHETLVTDTGGEGTPIVLVHPLGLDRLVWRDVIRATAGERRLVAHDLRGHGGAAGAPAGAGSALADDLLALIDTLGDRPVELVGAGSGAAVARDAARRLGDRVAVITLVAPLTPSAAPDPVAVMTSWLTPESLAADAPLVRYVRDRLRRTDRAAWATDATPSSDSWAAGTTTPVRLVVGDRDPEAGRARALADRLGAALHELPGAGHLLPVERPSEISRLIA